MARDEEASSAAAVAELSQLERMLRGDLYYPRDPQVAEMRERAHEVCRRFNTSSGSREERIQMLRELGMSFPDDAPPEIEPSFNVDYGVHISVGRDFYANFNCVLLDCARITIGDSCMLGPNVQVYTATHPLETHIRRSFLEFANPITIGDDVWIGGSAVICPGVTIGSRSVIGAGAVVTRDIPSDVLVVGSPAKVVRTLDPGGTFV